MLKDNYLKAKLESGRPVLGTWCVIPSPVTIEIIASSGMDFVIIDAEHGPISFETAQQMAVVAEACGTSPVMRVGGAIEADILKAMDVGMHAIQVPNVHNRTQAEELVEYSKFPPVGNRGFSPFTRAGGYTKQNSVAHFTTANDNVMLAIHIESEEGLNQIDEILKVDAIDILFIGLFDISKALGFPGETNHPKVQAVLRDLTAKIAAAGKYPGTITTSLDAIDEYIDFGMKYIVHLVDCEILLGAYQGVKQVFDSSSQSRYSKSSSL